MLRNVDARKEDEGNGKGDKPPFDPFNLLVLAKEVDTEKDAEKEKVEVKVETEARDTKELVKGKKIYVEYP